MRNVPDRRLGGLLAGAWLLLGLPAALPSPRPSPGAAWWEIRLTVTVKGDYSIKGGGEPLSGRFTCHALWEGAVERDDNDFLLYRLRSDTPEWALAEKASGPKGGDLESPPGTADKPVLCLNYILREGSELRLDFEFREVSVPLHASPAKFVLEFPRSTAQGTLLLASDYGDFVRRGSHRVVIPDSDLERSSAERAFAWEWRRERRVSGEAGGLVVTQRHTVEAVVKLRAR